MLIFKKSHPENNFLVLGDNREVSYDSRSFGLVNLTEIKGKVLK